MKRLQLLICVLPIILVACSSVSNKGTLAQLRTQTVVITEEETTGGLEKAMASYQRFLEDTTDSVLAPEAIRRLADLKVEREYGLITEGDEESQPSSDLPAPEPAASPEVALTEQTVEASLEDQESDAEFESRTTSTLSADELVANPVDPELKGDDLERVGTLEAIELYQKLLDEYPLYERNDQVLYQMSRAYEELGRNDDAMQVMNRMAREFPDSHYLDEVQFRRAEYSFIRRKYLDAEDAYTSIVNLGVGSSFYPLALYKLGWTFYKQELYEEALDRFIALLDYKVSIGYDFDQADDDSERKRMDDTFRVISLSFSYLGGAETVVDYFSRQGQRSYEDKVYNNLGEYYFSKRRYNDAVDTYTAFISRNPFHKMAPHFHMRVIEINIAGGFPTLVIDSKKAFATNYALKAQYWQYFEPSEHPEVLGYLKTNLTDLANHYHALYQKPQNAKLKAEHFTQALHWYREFLASFPADVESPVINYQLADLLLENHSFADAAVEYEKTAYDYPLHEQSSKAGYAAVYAYRKHHDTVPKADQIQVKQDIVRSSLTFAGTYPEHEKAAIILGAAADDLYGMGDFAQSLDAAQTLIENFPAAESEVLLSAWLVVAHSSYELQLYVEAEAAYMTVLQLLPEDDKTRVALVDNLAATIYKQGEQANALEDYLAAADHFLRISAVAPTSKIRPTAEYDAAAALIQLKDWKRAATVLIAFRSTFPEHQLQPEVTKKIAYVYREDGLNAQAAEEYERIERESTDDEVRREALLVAAQLYEDAGDKARALNVYQRYVGYFPQPVELNLETRSKIAEILKEQGGRELYLNELRQIVAIDAAAGDARTERTQYLASKAALVLAEVNYEQFVLVKLVKPFKDNLRKKQQMMKATIKEFGALLDYQVGEVTAAATYYMAEIYADFSRSLMESERPDGLSPLEMEEYELAIEEQAYPFEEKSITVHESNLELISLGVYNQWIEKSLAMLAVALPARYAKPEEESAIIASLVVFSYELAGLVAVTATGGVAVVAEPVQESGIVDDISPEPTPQEQESSGQDGIVETVGETEPSAAESEADDPQPTEQAESTEVQPEAVTTEDSPDVSNAATDEFGQDVDSAPVADPGKADVAEEGAPAETISVEEQISVENSEISTVESATEEPLVGSDIVTEEQVEVAGSEPVESVEKVEETEQVDLPAERRTTDPLPTETSPAEVDADSASEASIAEESPSVSNAVTEEPIATPDQNEASVFEEEPEQPVLTAEDELFDSLAEDSPQAAEATEEQPAAAAEESPVVSSGATDEAVPTSELEETDSAAYEEEAEQDTVSEESTPSDPVPAEDSVPVANNESLSEAIVDEDEAAEENPLQETEIDSKVSGLEEKTIPTETDQVAPEVEATDAPQDVTGE